MVAHVIANGTVLAHISHIQSSLLQMAILQVASEDNVIEGLIQDDSNYANNIVAIETFLTNQVKPLLPSFRAIRGNAQTAGMAQAAVRVQAVGGTP